MKVLLTGSTGFVGRNVLLELLKQQKYEVIYLPVRSEAKLRQQLMEEGFLEFPEVLKPLVMEAPNWDFSHLGVIDHVVHSAGVLFGNSLEDYMRTNTEGTLRLMQTVSTPNKIVILSSQAASGPCVGAQDYKTEQDQNRPLTWYGSSKLQMEQTVQAKFPQMNVVFLRPPMILGGRDTATLPLFKMANGIVQINPGFKKKQCSFVAVQDLVGAIIQVLQSEFSLSALPQKYFFVASDQVITDIDLIKTTTGLMNKKGRLIFIPEFLIWMASQIISVIPSLTKALPSLSRDRAKEIWPNKWVVSSHSFEKQFSWKAKVDLKGALTDTLDWYVKSGQLIVK